MKHSIARFMLVIFFCMVMYSVGMSADYSYLQHLTPGPNEVLIGGHHIEVPLNTILLIRKDKEICVVKFLEFWNGKTEEDLFGKCAIYYQNDGSGDFSKNNVKYSIENLFYPKPRGFHPFVFQLGRK